MDAIIQSFVSLLQDKIPEELVVFVISLFPVLELRGGLIAASLIDIEWWKAFAFCFLGNMLPMPFILLFIRKIFQLMKKCGPLGKIVDKLEEKAHKHSDKVEKYGFWGLFILVAIPLPGTGGWTGALVAALMDLRMKKALPAIALGVLVAGIIVGTLSYGIVGLFN
ncbi:MAG: small multi-drug export protein [Clostridia bacterium]|nr:small multi-drug export protein [Clostridia bacterium]